MIRFSIASFIFINFAVTASAQLQTSPDALPDITELPALDLSVSNISEAEPVTVVPALEFRVAGASSDGASERDIPQTQKDLIERLNYKKKEDPKLKRYKPEFGITASNVEIGASQKDGDLRN